MVTFWNRRKKVFQDQPSKSCEYPTSKGAKRAFNSGLPWKHWALNCPIGVDIMVLPKTHFEKNGGYL